MGNASILIVEAEGEITTSLPATLKGTGTDWQILRTRGTRGALDVIAQRNISMVVADGANHAEDCADLFRSLQNNHPDVIRLALTPGPVSGRESNAQQLAHQTIAVDCPPADIERALERGMSARDKLQANPQLIALMSKIDNLPTPPALYFDLRDEIDSPDSDAHSIADLIAKDAALSARILRIANSGFYALPCTVSDLHQATALLGTELVLGLVLSVHLFESPSLPGVNLDALWKHSFAVSALAREIVRALGGTLNDVNTSSIAGLLHDLGSLVLLHNFSGVYQPMIRDAAGDERALLQLELEHFRVGHPQLGGLMLDLWCFPPAIVKAVAHHHDASDPGGEDHAPVQAILLAEWLVNEYARCHGVIPPEEDLECPIAVPYEQVSQWWESYRQLSGQAV